MVARVAWDDEEQSDSDVFHHAIKYIRLQLKWQSTGLPSRRLRDHGSSTGPPIDEWAYTILWTKSQTPTIGDRNEVSGAAKSRYN